MMPFGKPRAIARRMLMVAAVSFSGAAFAADGAEEWLRNPSIGNYKAYAEFKMANYAEARAIWQVLAARENSEALFNLGILAEDGLGEDRDHRCQGQSRRTRTGFRGGLAALGQLEVAQLHPFA